MTATDAVVAGGPNPGRTCPRCGAAFICGMDQGRSPCWCTGLPVLAATRPEVGCYCPDCLKYLVEAAQDGKSATP